MADYATNTEDGEEPKSSGSMFATLKAGVREDQQASAPWRTEARTDFGFHAGGDQQWEKSDLESLDKTQTPHTTFNFIGPSVSAVIGMEVSNRNEVTFLPRTTQTPQQQPAMPGMPPAPPQPGADDQGPAETMTAANNYMRDQCDAEDEESDSFQDTAICGMGWTESRVVFDDNPNGEMKIDRRDPLEMGWDCNAVKRNLVDARRLWRIAEIPCKIAEEQFPGYDLEEIDAAWARPSAQDNEPHDADPQLAYRQSDGQTYHRKTVTIVEVTWFNVISVHRVGNLATGEVMENVSDATLKTLRKRMADLGQTINVHTIRRKEYRQAFLGAETILGDDQMGDLCQSQVGFKFKAITGSRDRNRKQWVGVVRAMRDPQRWANALYSSTLNTIMTSGKGIMAERSAFENPTEAESNWSSSDKITWLREGALSAQHPKVMQKVATPLQAGIFDILQFAIQAMRGVSGVNLETLGATDRDQAASLEYQRRQAATTILAPFFDGLRRYRKEQGRLAMDLIKNYLSDGRLVRIVGPDYERYVPLIKNDDVTEYDIIVAESPTSPNQKEASWATIQQMLPVVGKQLGPKTMAALMKASPLPESVVKDFKQAGEQEQADMMNAPPPPEVQLTQAQIKKTEAETEGKRVDAEVKKMDAAAQFQNLQLDMADRAGERQDRMAERAHKETMRGMDMQAAIDKHRADMASRRAEMQGASDQEFAKAAGADMPTQFKALADGLAALGEGFAKGMALLAQSQAELAKAVAAPRRTDLVFQGDMPVGATSQVAAA